MVTLITYGGRIMAENGFASREFAEIVVAAEVVAATAAAAAAAAEVAEMW